MPITQVTLITRAMLTTAAKMPQTQARMLIIVFETLITQTIQKMQVMLKIAVLKTATN